MNRCPACGSERYTRRVALDDSRHERYRSFSEIKYAGLLDGWMEGLQPEIAYCSDCGHHWYLRQPLPEQLSLMYANGRRLLSGAVSREPTQEMLAEMRRLAKLTGKTQPRLLDFGSGFGRWARAAARVGFRVHAYEPSESRGAEPVDEFVLVHNLTEIFGAQFDAINLEQVLEHVPAPLETLEQIKTYSSPDTILRISVPNILRTPEGASIWEEWPYDGKRVHAMAPFEHLHGFTPDSLLHVVRRAGFEPVGATRLIWRYPASVLRSWAGRWIPVLGQTFLIVRPVRA